MVDNNDQNPGDFLEEDNFLTAEDPYDRPSEPQKRPTLKEVFDQNPSFKLFGIVAAAGLVLITVMVFASGDDKPKTNETSAVKQAAEVSQPPGTAELPPAYEEAVRKSSEQRAETAEQTGGSAIPTPIARPSERIEAPIQVTDTDPLSEWRQEAEARRIERQQEEEKVSAPPALPVADAANPANGGIPGQAANAPPPLPTAPSQEQINQIAQQLQQQMQTVLETQVPKEAVLVSMNIQPGYDAKKYFPVEQTATTGTSGSYGQTGTNGSGLPINPVAPKPIVAAGSIAYAQVLTQANSDVPGPVLAEVASGPLAGGRAIGSFQKAEEHLVLQFDRVVKDGVEYPVQAFALDPQTTLPGVATEINNHYFSRIFLPAAARFISGFAEAATQKDNTTVTVNNGTVVTDTKDDLDTKEELLKGVNEAGQKLSEVVDEDADREKTIIVAQGTRIGILFTQGVFDPAQMQQGQQQATSPYGAYGNAAQAAFGATPAGMAYNAYNGYNNYNNGYYNPYNQSGQAQGFAPQYQTQTVNPAQTNLPALAR